MPTYRASNLSRPVGQNQGAVFSGTVTASAATANGDILVPMRLPAGLLVTAVMVNVRTAFGAAAPSSCGIRHTDGSTPSQANPEQLVAATANTALASTGMKDLLPRLGAFETEKESELIFTMGNPTTPAAGTVDVVVIGEFLGAK